MVIGRGWPIYGPGPSQIFLSPSYIFVIFFRSFCATNFHSRWRVGYVFSGQIVPSSYIYVRGESTLLVEARLFPDIRCAGGKGAYACNSLHTDVALCFFSFFSKTSASARKKNKERVFSFSLIPFPTTRRSLTRELWSCFGHKYLFTGLSEGELTGEGSHLAKSLGKGKGEERNFRV